MVKNLLAMQETWVQSLGWVVPWRRECNPLQYSCLENPVDRSLVDYSPWDCSKLDETEQLSRAHILIFGLNYLWPWGPFPTANLLHLNGYRTVPPTPPHTHLPSTPRHISKVLCYLSILICTVFLFLPLAPESGSSMFLSELLVLLPGILVPSLSRVQLFVTPWTTASQALLSMGFPRQEYWSGLPFLPPGDFPEPGIKLFPSPSLVGGFFTTVPLGKPWECPPLNSWWFSFINLLVKSYLIYNCSVYDIPPRTPLLFSWCCFSTSNIPLLSYCIFYLLSDTSVPFFKLFIFYLSIPN